MKIGVVATPVVAKVKAGEKFPAVDLLEGNHYLCSTSVCLRVR